VATQSLYHASHLVKHPFTSTYTTATVNITFSTVNVSHIAQPVMIG